MKNTILLLFAIYVVSGYQNNKEDKLSNSLTLDSIYLYSVKLDSKSDDYFNDYDSIKSYCQKTKCSIKFIEKDSLEKIKVELLKHKVIRKLFTSPEKSISHLKWANISDFYELYFSYSGKTKVVRIGGYYYQEPYDEKKIRPYPFWIEGKHYKNNLEIIGLLYHYKEYFK